jgi:hypothetical protein
VAATIVWIPTKNDLSTAVAAEAAAGRTSTAGLERGILANLNARSG